MRWRLIIEEFGTNIQHIAGIDNIWSDMISRLLSTSVNKYESSTSMSQCCASKLLEIGKGENNEDYFLPNIMNVQQ